MKLDKNTFLKSELGQGWVACITEWDMALGRRSKTQWGTLEYLEECKNCDHCSAQHEVYKLAVKQFYGVEYCFTRTDNYFGLIAEDGTGWLFRFDREDAKGSETFIF